jgi:kojibiose phosphorylase
MSIKVEPVGAFIFDVDGVIADTAVLHRAAWKRLADEEDLPFDEKQADAMRGASREQSLTILIGNRPVDRPRFVEMMERKNSYYLEAISRLSPADILPGADTLLADLCDINMRLAAASASQSANQVLRLLGLYDRFDVVIGGDSAPDSSGLHRFLKASAALRVEPRRCVVVEDAAAQIAIARGYGMKTVGVGDRSRLCAAMLVFESLRGVDARHLLRWVSRASDLDTAAPASEPSPVAASALYRSNNKAWLSK